MEQKRPSHELNRELDWLLVVVNWLLVDSKDQVLVKPVHSDEINGCKKKQDWEASREHESMHYYDSYLSQSVVQVKSSTFVKIFVLNLNGFFRLSLI